MSTAPQFVSDVQVCLPGHGCTDYVPLAGQLANAAIAVGPGVIDGVLAAVLVAVLAVLVVAVCIAVRRRRLDRPALLLIVGGALAAVPPLVPAVAPLHEVFMLASAASAGLGLVLLGRGLDAGPRVALAVAGGLRLLALPAVLVDVVTASALAPFPDYPVGALGGLAFAVAALVLLVSPGRLGPLRWSLLVPILPTAAAGLRLTVPPFAAAPWVGAMPGVAMCTAGVLLLSAPRPARPVPIRPLIATVAVLAVVLGALLLWPTSTAPTGPDADAARSRCLLRHGFVVAASSVTEVDTEVDTAQSGDPAFFAPVQTARAGAARACAPA